MILEDDKNQLDSVNNSSVFSIKDSFNWLANESPSIPTQ